MANKKEGVANKTYCFKVKRMYDMNLETIKKTIDEFDYGYNLCSEALHKILTEKTIVLDSYIPESSKDKARSKYIKDKEIEENGGKKASKGFPLLVTEDYADKPIYAFIEEVDANKVDNALYWYFKKALNGYGETNSLHINESTFRRNGFCKQVGGNYRTKLQQFNNLGIQKIKKVDITSESPYEVILEQCARDVMCYASREHLKNISDFNTKTFAKTLSDKKASGDKVQKKELERCELMCKFFKEHETDVKRKIEKLTVEIMPVCSHDLNSERKVMSVIWGSTSTTKDTAIYDANGKQIGFRKGNLTITQISKYDFNFRFDPSSGHGFSCDVWGRKDIIKGDDVLVVLYEAMSNNTLFKIVDNTMYIHLSCSAPFKTKTTPIPKMADEKKVGCDVNTKHAFLQFDEGVNVDDLKGYVNIYQALIEDKAYNELCKKYPTEGNKSLYETLSKHACFCPIESQWLMYRAIPRKDENGKEFKDDSRNPIANKFEEVFSQVIDRLLDEAKTKGEHEKVYYLGCVRKFRQKLLSVCRIQTAYDYSGTLYAIGVNKAFPDSEQAKKELASHPFNTTEKGKEMLQKKENIRKRIISCRNNIIHYAYSVLAKNGYGCIALENLTTAGLEKKGSDYMKYPETFLYSKGFLGMTKEEIQKDQYLKKLYDEKMYKYDTDKEGRIENILFTKEGKQRKEKSDFNNFALKMVHFASVKDYFVTLQNKGTVAVAWVPSEYSSQIDSKEHILYVEEKKKGKRIVPVKKELVRPNQEDYFINGLNADINAANNIRYYVLNNSKFGNFVQCIDVEFNKPSCSPTKGDIVKKIQDSEQFRTLNQDFS